MNPIRILSTVGIVLIAAFAVGLAIKAALGVLTGALHVLFWASVLAGIVALSSLVWRKTSSR
jgi:hypothetical protein